MSNQKSVPGDKDLGHGQDLGMQDEGERRLTQAELIEQFKQDEPWKAWLLMNGRKLAFAAAMLLFLVGLILFGGNETPPAAN